MNPAFIYYAISYFNGTYCGSFNLLEIHFPAFHQISNKLGMLVLLTLYNRFCPECAGRAGLHTFTTRGAGSTFAPGGVEI